MHNLTDWICILIVARNSRRTPPQIPTFCKSKIKSRKLDCPPFVGQRAAQEIMIWDWLSAEMHAHFLPFPPSHGQMPNWIWYIGRTIIGRQICFPPFRGAGRGPVGVQPPSCRSSAAPTWRTCACRGTWERGWWSLSARLRDIFFSLFQNIDEKH